MDKSESYEEQIGRVRSMIAGTGGYENLTDLDRSAIRTVFQDRLDLITACGSEDESSRLNSLRLILDEVPQEGLPEYRETEDSIREPEVRTNDSDWRWAIKHAEGMYLDLFRILQRVQGEGDG